jgi:predicted O-methyltransferase YrrM
MRDGIKKSFERRQLIKSQTRSLEQIPALTCKTESLRTLTDKDLAKIFDCFESRDDWSQAEADLIRACQIEDGTTGGVNPGDRRAVWYLIKGFGATSVLEIGTHVGASTVHIASALQSMKRRDPSISPHLVTVDVQDVNSEVGAWKGYGLTSSPRDMIQAIGCDDLVSFVTENSLTFLDRCKDKYDFIFLDGDHSASTVYQEIPRALKVLKKDGVILLHDFFPKNRPIWVNGLLVAGPYLGTTRLRREGVPIKVVPLGELPWATKLGSRVTSLALVTRD